MNGLRPYGLCLYGTRTRWDGRGRVAVANCSSRCLCLGEDGYFVNVGRGSSCPNGWAVRTSLAAGGRTIPGGAAVVPRKPAKVGRGKGGSDSWQVNERYGGLTSLKKENISQIQRRLAQAVAADPFASETKSASDVGKPLLKRLITFAPGPNDALWTPPRE